jgi:UDP-2-acetamido-2,6-beta-L-arabino-hexul-4-ose reductase
MIRIGITGQAGFVGTHLYNFLGLQNNVKRIDFSDTFFSENTTDLEHFVAQCDVIVHLAAMNRHPDPQVIYDTNVGLVAQLIAACERTNVSPHILFSSSIQEKADNLYGKSKLDGRKMLEKWAKKAGGRVSGLVIPNVFGPFGKPFYNSVVATFCHQLTHGATPTINVDSAVKLIYVNELVAIIYKAILDQTSGKIAIKHTKEIKVSEILALLNSYKTDYFDNGVFPSLEQDFEKALFNTFRCYVPHSHYPFYLKNNVDNRGNFVEIARTGSSGQFSFSITHPNITRGNHFHTRKAERFAVIQGKALIQLRKVDSDEVIDYYLDGEKPSFVDMPIWYTHNIKNIGEEDLITLFWINEPYNPEDPDTYFVNV